MGGPSALSQPVIERLTPPRQGEAGIVRLDVDLKGQTLDAVFIGGVLVPLVDLDELAAGRTYLVTLPAVAQEGQVLSVRLRTGPQPLFSNTVQLGVLSQQSPTLDAPTPRAATSALTLTGRGLTGATHVLLWPDVGLATSSQVTTLATTSVTPASVSVAPPGLPSGLYRCAVRLASGAFTPFVLLELTP
jgi:hypothetical protein